MTIDTGNPTLNSILVIIGAVTTIAATIAGFLPKGSKAAVFLMRVSALDGRGHVASSTAGKP